MSRTGNEEMAMPKETNAVTVGNALYGLGIFGAWVWFWQQAEGFWGHALAVLEGVFWPAFMVYHAFAALH
jgi:hypothetical protein